MTTAKTIFQRKEPGKQSLADWWVTVIHDPRFEFVMTCARAETMELRPTQPQMEGGEMMLATLLTLSDNEDVSAEFPTPGLVHHMPGKQVEPEKTED